MYRPLAGAWQNTAELETIWKLNLSLTLSGRLRWAISLVLIDAIKSKIENNTAQKSIDVLSRKEKTCEKLNFSPVIKITSNAIPKY